MSSFGGGNTQYTLEYIIKVTNQGGTGGFNQINTGMKQMQTSSLNVSAAMEKMEAANQKVIQAGQGVSKAAKGMAFGFLGIATAGAEAVGMLSMYQQTQAAVKVATEEQSKALAEGGKQSKAYKDATNDLIKANRWARMTFRNLMLSMFDLIPFFVLSVNGILKLKTAYKALREAQLEQAAMKQVLAAAGIKEAAATELQNASYASLTKQQRLLKAEQALGIKSTEALTVRQDALAASSIAAGASIGKAEGATRVFGGTALATAGKVAKIVIPLAAIGAALIIFGKNIFGVRDKINQFGVSLGQQFPQLKGFLDILGKVGESIVAIVNLDFDKIGKIWSGTASGATDAAGGIKELSKAEKEAAEELAKFREDAFSTMREFAQETDKKSIKDWLVKFGIKGKGKDIEKDFKGFAKELRKFEHEAEQAHDKLDLLETINLMEKFGLDTGLDKKTITKIRNTLGSDFQDMFKGKNDIFSQLGDIIKKNANKNQDEFNQVIADFVAKHPGLMEVLKKKAPELAAQIQGYIDEAKQTATTNMTPNEKDDALWDKAFSLPEEHHDFKNGVDVTKSPAQKMVESMITSLTTAIKNADWTAIGTSIRTAFLKIFTTENLNQLGMDLKAYVINPIMLALQGAFGEFVADLQKDPVATLIGTFNAFTLPIASLVAGLFGAKSEKEMFNGWEAQLVALFVKVPFLMWVRDLINNPTKTIVDTISGAYGVDMGDESQADEQDNPEIVDPVAFTASKVFDALGLTDILGKFGKAWDELKTGLFNNPTLGDLGLMVTDFPAWVKKHIAEFITAVQPGSAAEQNLKKQGVQEGGNLGGFAADVQKNVQKYFDDNFGKTPIQAQVPTQVVPKMVQQESGPNVQGLWDFVGPTSGADLLGQWANNIINSLTQKTGLSGPGANGIGGPTWIKEKSFLRLSIPVQVEPSIQNVSDNRNSGNSFSTQFVNFATQAISKMQDIWDSTLTGMLDVLGVFVENAAELFGDLTVNLFTLYDTISKGWLVIMAGMAEGSNEIFMQTTLDDWADGFDAIGETFDATGELWNETMSTMSDDGITAMEDILDGWSEGFDAIGETFDAMTEAWSNSMDSMVSDAQSAVSKINSAIQGIQDKTVTIHVQREGSFAKGGLVSAAGGRRFTTNGPTILGNAILGDNPGGIESLWAIPHNNPGKTVNDINNFYGTSSKSNGTPMLNQNLTVIIDGNGIINDKKLTKKITTSVGSNRDRFG